MIHIVTSGDCVISLQVRAQETRLGDPAVAASLALPLQRLISSEVFLEQQEYLLSAAKAAYASLNPLDQKNRFKVTVNLKTDQHSDFNLVKGSTSSGLGFALAIFQAYWLDVLGKTSKFPTPIFATGEIINSGELRAIGFIEQKLEAIITYINNFDIDSFAVCMPLGNFESIPQSLMRRITDAGGKIIAENSLPRVLAELLGADYDGESLGRWEPFKGLDSFNYEDSMRFFGRSNEIKKLYDDLLASNGALIVSGSSGAGKSSLIKAGLIPYVEANTHCVKWTSTTAGEMTEDYIAQQLGISSFDDIKDLKDPDECLYLIHIDQLDDIFIEPERNHSVSEVLAQLCSLVKNSSKVKLILTIRSEYLVHLLELNLIEQPFISNISGQLTASAWREVIEEQAEFSAIKLEDGLSNLIISEAMSMDNSLPMVEFVLHHLYQKSVNENLKSLKIEHFNAMGGLAGAIAEQAEDTLVKNSINDAQLDAFFAYFIQISPNGAPLPKAQPLNNDIVDASNILPVIEALQEKRLITQSSLNSEYIYKLAHSSLFASWSRLKNWVDDNYGYLLWRSEIEHKYKRWKEESQRWKKSEYLLSDKSLISSGKDFAKQDLINELSLLRYLQLSKSKTLSVLGVNFSLFILVIFLVISAVPMLSYSPQPVEINVETCNMENNKRDLLEIYVTRKKTATNIKNILCKKDSTILNEINKHYGAVKIYWKSLSTYDVSKLIDGKIAVLVSSETSLEAGAIVSNKDLYTPIAKLPDYYSCLLTDKRKTIPELDYAYLKDKRIGLLNKPYSQSGYQTPYLELVKAGASPNQFIKFQEHWPLRKAVLGRTAKVDVIGSYCPSNQEDKKKFNYIEIGQEQKGMTWYIATKTKLPSLKCKLLNHLVSEAKSNSDPYYSQLEVLNGKGCEIVNSK